MNRFWRHLSVKDRQIYDTDSSVISPEILLLFNIGHVDTWRKDMASGWDFPNCARQLLTVRNKNLIFWRGRGGGPQADVVVKRFKVGRGVRPARGRPRDWPTDVTRKQGKKEQ